MGILACKYDEKTVFTDAIREGWIKDGPSEGYLGKLKKLVN